MSAVGLDGLTMRVLAKELGVQAPTLYWHVKNKQQLLDAMADLLAAEATTVWRRRAATRRGRSGSPRWPSGRPHAAALPGRGAGGGGNVFVEPAVGRTVELILRTLQDAGFEPVVAARAFPVIQARRGEAYNKNPYESSLRVDPERFPLTAGVAEELYPADTDANCRYGLSLILAGMANLVVPPR